MANRLFTKYEKVMDREPPHSYYPRPSMVRESYLSLNGEWSFGTSKSADDAEYRERILVPFPPESRLSGIERSIAKDEYMHYKRSVHLPHGFINERVILHFGAIDQEAWVYVNGSLVATRLGGYIPFEADITELISGEEFELHVVCKDSLDKKYPYGKQTDKRGGMWYTPVSGIWQSVWLESVPKEHICKLKFTQIEGGVHLDVLGAARGEVILDSGERFAFDESGADILPSELHPWSPEEPYIYRLSVNTETD